MMHWPVWRVFDNLTSLGGFLSIVNNPALSSLTRLDNITSIDGELQYGSTMH